MRIVVRACLIGSAFGVAGAVSFACDKTKKSSSSALPSTPVASAPVPAGARVVAVTASEQGYSPSTIAAKRGETLILRFTRTTPSECLKVIAIPELNIKQELPVNVAVDVPVKLDKEGKVTFQCGMAMFKGSIDVT